MTGRLIPVPEGLAGERVDIALTRLLGLSRTRAAALVDAGGVEIAGQAAVKSDRLPADSMLWIDADALRGPQEPQVPAEPVAGLAVLYEDDDLVVVDKPIGVAAHPSPGWTGPTVTAGLAAAGFAVATSGAAERQGIVHRLDVGTSGVMAVAKSEAGYASLKQQFRERTVDKTYLAVVQGLLDPTAGTIDAPIDRHPTASYRFAVVSGGKPSVTHYQTIEAFAHASLVQVRLETGRTHQIRVHMSAMRHPCAPTARIRCWRGGWDYSDSGCMRCGWDSTTRHRGPGSRSPASSRMTCAGRWSAFAPVTAPVVRVAG